jgi:hypothetical protein
MGEWRFLFGRSRLRISGQKGISSSRFRCVMPSPTSSGRNGTLCHAVWGMPGNQLFESWRANSDGQGRGDKCRLPTDARVERNLKFLIVSLVIGSVVDRSPLIVDRAFARLLRTIDWVSVAFCRECLPTLFFEGAADVWPGDRNDPEWTFHDAACLLI